jgi:hypothetical protein
MQTVYDIIRSPLRLAIAGRRVDVVGARVDDRLDPPVGVVLAAIAEGRTTGDDPGTAVVSGAEGVGWDHGRSSFFRVDRTVNDRCGLGVLMAALLDQGSGSRGGSLDGGAPRSRHARLVLRRCRTPFEHQRTQERCRATGGHSNALLPACL